MPFVGVKTIKMLIGHTCSTGEMQTILVIQPLEKYVGIAMPTT